MRLGLRVLAALLLPLGLPTSVLAGQRDDAGSLLQTTHERYSQIIGTVRDEAGSAIPGVSVLALGSTLAAVKSDLAGRFVMLLPAGEYVLRAMRDGYVSTYREAVRVEGDALLRRTITLLRATGAVSAQPGVGAVSTRGGDPEASDGPAPTDVAWRLRHLPRTVLRERASPPGMESPPSTSARSFDGKASGLDDFGLTGSVDLITTSSFTVSQGVPVTSDFPRGVAYVIVGAPVGDRGDWSIRAALAPDTASSWTFVGEYEARAERRHQFRTGVTYSAQTLPADRGAAYLMRPDDVLRAGGVYGEDRWSVGDRVELSYGGRFDRFDYLADPNLFSGSVRVNGRIGPGARLFTSLSHHRVAPGSDQFQPPSVTGVWLPPDRTFSSFDSPEGLAAEAVGRREIGASYAPARSAAPGGDDPVVVTVSRFVEETAGQIVTVFGLDPKHSAGHYHVGVLGSPRVEGVTVEFAGRFGTRAHGRVAYSATETTWTPSQRAVYLRPSQIGLSRDNRRGHDLTTAFEGTIPLTSTTLNLIARVNDWYGDSSEGPRLGARFALELQQPLPLRGFGDQGVTLVLGARTLLSDGAVGRSYYDDLLTVEPPLRVTCGIQMRF